MHKYTMCLTSRSINQTMKLGEGEFIIIQININL